MKRLLHEVVGPYEGKPILVICGGPSTAVNLKHIPLDFPACVISANEHGFKQDRFKVDFIVNVDWNFASSRQTMRERLTPYGVPIINRWSWATYRLPEWVFNGDSGLTAVMVGVLLGGHPVVPLGLDRYTGERRYFWQEGAEPNWSRRQMPNIDNIRVNTAQCVERSRSAQVRIFDSPMRAYWPVFNHPVEILPAWVPCDLPARTLTGELYQIQRPIFLHPQDRVFDGVIRLTDREARPHLRTGHISPIVAPSD